MEGWKGGRVEGWKGGSRLLFCHIKKTKMCYYGFIMKNLLSLILFFAATSAFALEPYQIDTRNGNEEPYWDYPYWFEGTVSASDIWPFDPYTLWEEPAGVGSDFYAGRALRAKIIGATAYSPLPDIAQVASSTGYINLGDMVRSPTAYYVAEFIDGTTVWVEQVNPKGYKKINVTKNNVADWNPYAATTTRGAIVADIHEATYSIQERRGVNIFPYDNSGQAGEDILQMWSGASHFIIGTTESPLQDSADYIIKTTTAVADELSWLDYNYQYDPPYETDKYGVVLEFLPGDYYLEGGLSFLDNSDVVGVIGTPGETTLYQSVDANWNGAFFQNMEFAKDLILYGQGPNATRTSYGLDNITYIENVKVYNVNGYGLDGDILINCYAENCDGVGLTGSESVRDSSVYYCNGGIKGGDVENCDVGEIWRLTSLSYAIDGDNVANCNVTDASNGGIQATGGVVANCNVNRVKGEYAIDANAIETCVVVDVADGLSARYINNTSIDNATGLLATVSGSIGTANGLTATDGDTGLLLGGYGVRVSNSYIGRTTGTMLDTGASTIFYAENTEFIDSGGTTLLVEGTETYLDNCKLTGGTGDYVIYHESPLHLNNTTLSDNAGTGIYSPGGIVTPSGAASVYVYDSILEYNRGLGNIWMNFGGSMARIHDSEIKGGTYGIYLNSIGLGDEAGVHIQNNRFQDNNNGTTGRDIMIQNVFLSDWYFPMVTITGNTFSQNIAGCTMVVLDVDTFGSGVNSQPRTYITDNFVSSASDYYQPLVVDKSDYPVDIVMQHLQAADWLLASTHITLHNYAGTIEYGDKTFVGDATHSNLTILDGSTTFKYLASQTVDLATGGNLADYLQFFNGAIKEDHETGASSNGTIVTATLANRDTSEDLSLIFFGGTVAFDTTPAASVVLTPGSDTTPTMNWVYIPYSTLVLTAGTSGWPTVAHVPIGKFWVRSAATTQTKGLAMLFAHTDHLRSANGQGHGTHINRRIRQESSPYDSDSGGMDYTFDTTGANDIDISVTAGYAWQMHPHLCPAWDTAAGDDVHIYNRSGDSWHTVTDIADADEDTSGNTMGHKDVTNLVFWQIMSEHTKDSHLMVMEPDAFYSNTVDGIADPFGYANYVLPGDVKGSALLICRAVIEFQNPATWTVVHTEDLREGSGSGGGAGGFDPDIPDNAFRVHDADDPTARVVFDASQVTTSTDQVWGVPDYPGMVHVGPDLAAAYSKAGFGTSYPEYLMHIFAGESGAGATGNSDDIVGEGSGDFGLTFLSPNANRTRLRFGSPADQTAAKLDWDYTNAVFAMGTTMAGATTIIVSGNNTPAIHINDNQHVGIGASPGAATLLIQTNPSGVTSYPAAQDELVIEQWGSAGGMSILVPDTGLGYANFGTPSDTIGAFYQWNYNSGTDPTFYIGTHTTGGLTAFGAGVGVPVAMIRSVSPEFQVWGQVEAYGYQISSAIIPDPDLLDDDGIPIPAKIDIRNVTGEMIDLGSLVPSEEPEGRTWLRNPAYYAAIHDATYVEFKKTHGFFKERVSGVIAEELADSIRTDRGWDVSKMALKNMWRLKRFRSRINRLEDNLRTTMVRQRTMNDRLKILEGR